MAAALVVAVYAVGAVLFGPHLVESRVRAYLAASGELSLTVARTRFNPFTLTAEFHDARVAASAIELIRAERIRAAFDPLALWRPGLRLRVLGFDRPGASMPWSRAALAGLTGWIRAAFSGAHPLRVERLEIQDGSVRFTGIGERPRHLELDRIRLLGGDRLIAAARHSLGGRLEVSARLGPSPPAAEGSFTLVADDPARLLRWLGVQFDQAAGQLELSGDFSAGLEPGAHPKLAGLTLGAERIELKAGTEALRLERLRVSALDLDPKLRAARAGALTIDGGALTAAGASRALAAANRLLAAASTWSVAVGRVETRALALELDPQEGGKPWRFEPIELSMNGFDSTGANAAEFTLSSGIKPHGWLAADGRVRAIAREFEAAVELADLDLVALSPHLGLVPGLALAGGRAAAEATLRYESGALEMSGHARLNDLALTDRADGQPLFTAAAATLSGIAVDAGTRPSIDRVRLDGPVLNLRLDRDGRLIPDGWSDVHRGVGPTIGRLEIAGGALTLSDARLTPPVELRAAGLEGAADGLGGAGAAVLELTGKLNDSARARLAARWRNGPSRVPWRLDVMLGPLERALLDPYAARFLGRGVEAGTMNLALLYGIGGNRFVGRHQAVIDGLRLAPDPAAAPGRLDLAQALLQDPAGRIDVTIPAGAGLEDGGFDLGATVTSAVEVFLADLEADPFRALGELVGVPGGGLGTVEFEPGSAALTAATQARLSALREALLRRPALAVRIAGGWANDADGRALARRQLHLHVALATGAAPPGSADPGPPAFGDPKVHSVLDEFAGERLRSEQRAAIEDRAAGDPADFYRALFEALVANEPIADGPLRKLARYRAQAIAAELDALGVPGGRVRVAEPVAVTAAGPVPIALGLEIVPVVDAGGAAASR